MKKLVIFGCGGHGREVADVVDAINLMSPTWDLLGLADDNPSDTDIERLRRTGRRLLQRTDYEALGPGTAFVIGIGSGTTRRAIDARVGKLGWEPVVLVHPFATIGADVSLGAGTVLCAGVHLTNNIRLRRHVHVNRNSTIGHDGEIGDFVTIHPLVAVSGGVILGDEVTLGTHSSILQNLTMGERSVAGAASCVVRNVPEGTIVKGVPAK